MYVQNPETRVFRSDAYFRKKQKIPSNFPAAKWAAAGFFRYPMGDALNSLDGRFGDTLL